MVLKTPSSSSSSFFVFFFFLFLSSVSLSSISNSSSFSFDQWLEGLISTETKTEREREIERERRGADPMSVRAWHLGPEIARDFSSDFDYVTHIDVSSAWRSLVRGSGIIISVMDSYIDVQNTDLKDRWSPEMSDSFSFEVVKSSGTSVAGVALGTVMNGYCSVGVAFNATLSAIQCDWEMDPYDRALALKRAFEHGQDVLVSSVSPPDTGFNLEAISPEENDVLLDLVQHKRDGRGGIVVVSSGEGGLVNDNCNYNGFASSIYTITVGSVGYDGIPGPKAEQCAAQLIVAPAKSQSFLPGIATTTNPIEGGCTEDVSSSSVSAGVVAGTIALMLEANPRLTYRDVQHILVRTASTERLGAKKLSKGWETNGGGLKVHEDYGFGVVDAGKAVEVAKTWTEIPPLLLCATEESGEWSSDRFVTSIHVSDQISVEHVCVIVTIDHPYSGDLRITLRSPRGLLSTLATPRSVINRKILITATDYWGDEVGMWQGLENSFGKHIGRDETIQTQSSYVNEPLSDNRNPCTDYATNADVHILHLSSAIEQAQHDCSYVDIVLLAQAKGAKVVILISPEEEFSAPATTGAERVWIPSYVVSSQVGRELGSRRAHGALYSFGLIYEKPDVPQYQMWPLCSVRYWGEKTIGDWELQIVDEIPESPLTSSDQDHGKVKFWRLELYGNSEHGMFTGSGMLVSPYYVPPSDPIFNKQWHLGLSGGGEDINLNLGQAWKKIVTGKGVLIGFLTEYVDLNMLDIRDSVDYDVSSKAPLPRDSPATFHASLAAANANDVCGVGVAPEANISWALYSLRSPLFIRTDALNHCSQTSICVLDPAMKSQFLLQPDAQEVQIMKEAMRYGRDGKGTVFLWGAGDFQDKVDCNLNGYLNMPFGIVVGSVSNDGFITSYSSHCAMTMVVAPAGDSSKKQLFSADTGENNCVEGGKGTAVSASLVSGVVALMLEVRDELTWRDVQHILVETATDKGLTSDLNWETNGAGKKIHENFGYGLIDGSSAVALASKWKLLPPMKFLQIEEDDFNGELFPGDIGSATASFYSNSFIVEKVSVIVDIACPASENLGIYLESPAGTLSHFVSPLLYLTDMTYTLSILGRSMSNPVNVTALPSFGTQGRSETFFSVAEIPKSKYCSPYDERAGVHVYVEQSKCSIQTLFLNAQNSGARCILYINSADSLFIFPEDEGLDLIIPVFMITKESGQELSSLWRNEVQYLDFSKVLSNFVVSFCFSLIERGFDIDMECKQFFRHFL